MGGGKCEEDDMKLLVDVQEKLSMHDATARAPEDAVVQEPATVDDAKPARWMPRWKTDSSIKPTAYRKEPRQQAPLPPGIYRSRDVADKLRCSDQHSFLLSEREMLQCGDDGGKDGEHEHTAERTEKIVAIMFHHGANPDPVSPDTYELWTRHCFQAIRNHKDVPLPFYKRTERNTSLYEHGGTYKIVESTLVKGRSPELVEFVRRRGLSNKNAAPEVWRSKLVQDWLKVTIQRCKEGEQLKDPMVRAENGEKQAG